VDIQNKTCSRSKMKWKLHQMDVKTTFLNGVIEEEVYIENHKGLKLKIERLMSAS
jgi:hypothetical protein